MPSDCSGVSCVFTKVILMSRLSGIVAGSYLSSFLQNTLKTNQVEINTDNRTLKAVAKLKEPRDLFALPKELDCPQQAARWPTECQVLDERVQHVDTSLSAVEEYYQPTGREVQPKPVGEEAGQVVFQYYPVSAVNYFSRSSVGGSKYLMDSCPCGDWVDGLRFESRFESGNLAKVVKITDTYYELYLRTDMYTNRHMQWYYFRVENTKSNMLYRFSLVNLCKGESLYSVGMRPLLYSTKDAQLKGIGWRRCGDNIAYYRNELSPGEEDQLPSYTLTFNIEFPHDNDQVYLAHCYPYTYTDLQDYLIQLQKHPVKSTYSKLRLLCRSLAGNNVYYLTVTAPSLQDECKKKKAIVVTARVHPGESPASWMMKGFMDFLTGESLQARELRDKFIFKLVPMLNPDGVIVGNNRCSLTGRDLNRQYRTVMRETYPPVWHTKLMIRRLMEECGIEMYCDLHAHSRKHSIFIYGCENRRSADRLQEQVFPLMLHKNAADKFSFESCKFRIQRCKEGTGRVVVWMMGVANSYTMEASFGGSALGGRSGTHFTTQDYEQMGRHFCETLLDYCDQDPSKERLRCKIINRLAREGSSADEPTNISLSDYSSDVGDTSSSSEDEGAGMGSVPGTEDCCLPLQVPPPSPVLPKREHHKSGVPPDHMPDHASVAPAALDLSPQLQRTRPTLMVHRATIDLGTDPGSDLNDPATDSGDDSLSWRHRGRGRAKFDISSGRVSTNKCIAVGDMPPELIVTSAQAQVTDVDTNEKVLEKQAEGTVTRESEHQQTEKLRQHKSSQMSVGVNRACKLANPRPMTEITQSRQNSLLRTKIWTGIPCTCHEPNAPTHWSGRGGEASLLQACSQKLSTLQKQKHDPVGRSRKPKKKQGADSRPRRTSVSDTSAGEETKRLGILENIKKSNRYPTKHDTRHNGIRQRHKDSSNDTSPGDDVETDSADVKKLLRKCKLQKWKAVTHSSRSKYTCESLGRHQEQRAHQPEPSCHSRQAKARRKPSLKWKFCHAVATMVTGNDNNGRDTDSPVGSGSESDIEDSKPEVPAVRVSTANSKKKKKRKSTAGQKKSRRTSSAAAAPSTSGKQRTSKKLVKLQQ